MKSLRSMSRPERIGLGLLLMAVGWSALAAFGEKGKPQEISHEGMTLIQGGSYLMGRDSSYPDEAPVHQVDVDAFWIDRHEVTNHEFAAFVSATGYVTQAEKGGSCWCYLDGASEFATVAGADWRHPQGPNSSLQERMDHPVVCVNWKDAQAYATWAGKRLLTEAEWEYAARAGSAGHLTASDSRTAEPKAEFVDAEVAGGNAVLAGTGSGCCAVAGSGASSCAVAGAGASNCALAVSGDLAIITANVWEGVWPEQNRQTDGYFYTAPVGKYSANAWGVHDMIGNVWEWTSDWYAATYYQDSPRVNPAGPATGDKRVARGGSWFCSPNYCGAYSTHFRGASPATHAFNNVGFRCARDVDGS